MLDEAAQQTIRADIRQVEHDLENLRAKPGFSKREEALMETKIALDRAILSPTPLPWPFDRGSEIVIGDKKYPVENRRIAP